MRRLTVTFPLGTLGAGGDGGTGAFGELCAPLKKSWLRLFAVLVWIVETLKKPRIQEINIPLYGFDTHCTFTT